MKKILFISSWFPSKANPTHGIFVQRQAEAAALLNSVEILKVLSAAHQKVDYDFEENSINGIKTTVVFYKRSHLNIVNIYRKFTAYEKGFKRITKPDLIHANILQYEMLFAVYLKVVAKIPFVISEHWSLFLPENSNGISIFQRMIYRFIANNAAFVLPVSVLLEKNLKRLKIGKKFQTIGNVVDTEFFQVSRKANSTQKTFLHLSSLIELKKPESIIKVAVQLRSKYKNFYLQIGGDGDRSVLQSLVVENEAEDFIFLFGQLSPKEVHEKMGASDCFILFSDHETFGCVILESLAVGKPVITTKAGIAQEVITAENGILINNSEIELYVAMEKFLVENRSFDVEKMHLDVERRFGKMQIAKKLSSVYEMIK